MFPPGTIVFAKIGAALLLARFSIIGRAACIDNNMAAFHTQRAPGPIRATFCRLCRRLTWRQWCSLGRFHRSARKHSTAIPSRCPTSPPKRQIADFLDRETARIDQLVEKKQRFISLANERWISELNDAVFPTFPNWFHLPVEWEKVPLKHLTDPMRPIMYGIVLPGPNVEFGKLIVKGGDVKPGRLDPELLCKTTIEIESSYVRSRVKAGDLIISIRGGIGDLEVVPKTIEGANLTQDVARIAPKSGIDVEWLRYALSAPVVFHLLEAKSLGAAVRGINIFDLKRVFVPTPPSEIQTRIRDSLVAAERRLARLKELVVQHTEKIQEFRSALITAAVSGQIDVSTWSKKGMTERRFDQIEEATSA